MSATTISRINWPKYLFFTKDVIEENIQQLLDAKPCCGVAEAGIILFGDEKGYIHVSDRNLQLSEENKYKVFRGPVCGIAYINDYYSSPPKRYIITVGDDSIPTTASSLISATTPSEQSTHSTPPHYVIKIFSSLSMHRPLQVFSAMSGVPVGASLTAFTVMNDGSQIALGFSSGTVSVFIGPFIKDVSSSSNNKTNIVTMIAPQISIRNQPYPVSNLYFAEIPVPISTNNGRLSVGGNFPAATSAYERRIHLFVVMDTKSTSNTSTTESSTTMNESSAGIFSLDTSVTVQHSASLTAATDSTHSQQSQQQWLSPNRHLPQFLDDEGAEVSCASYMSDTRELVIGRQEGVFSYTVEERGGAVGLEGSKQQVHCFDKYVLIVSNSSSDDKTTATSATTGTSTNKEVVTIYDLRNKFIAASIQLSVGESIKLVLYDKGTRNGYLITSHHQVIKLSEKNQHSKSQLLMNKSLYPLAITLAAESQQVTVMELMSLYESYAQYLYHKKQDYHQSILQYCHTIGYLPSSTVISLFLDSAKLIYLVIYLEALHEKGIANKDHTTLLLTCYIQLKQIEKLKLFVETNDKAVYPLPISPLLPPSSSTATTAPSNTSPRNTINTSTADTVTGFLNTITDNGNVNTNTTSNNNRFKKLADADEYSFDAPTAVSLLLKAAVASSSAQTQQQLPSFSSSTTSQLYVDLAYTLALRHKCYRQCADIYVKYRRQSASHSSSTSNSDDKNDSNVAVVEVDVMGVLSLITALLFEVDEESNDKYDDVNSIKNKLKQQQQRVSHYDDIRYILFTYFKELLLTQRVLFISFLVNMCLRQYDKLIINNNNNNAVDKNQKSQLSRAQYLSTLPPILLPESIFYFFNSSCSNNSSSSNNKNSSNQLSPSLSSQSLLLLFVESLVTELRNNSKAFISSSLITTLFELYLIEYADISTQLISIKSTQTTANTNDKANAISTTATTSSSTYIMQLETKLTSLSSKALSLLQYENTDYDCNQLLLLCTVHHFQQGKLYLLEKMNNGNSDSNLTQLLLRLRIESGDDKGLLQLLQDQCSSSGSSSSSHHPNDSNSVAELFTQVIRYLLDKQTVTMDDNSSSNGNIGDDYDNNRWEPLSQVLSLAQQEGILSPMQVLSLLSSHPHVPYHLVSDSMRNIIGQSTIELHQLYQNMQQVQDSIQQARQQQELQQLNDDDDQVTITAAAAAGGSSASSSTNPFDTTVTKDLSNNPFDSSDNNNIIASSSTNPFDDNDDGVVDKRKHIQSEQQRLQQQQRQKWQDIRNGLLMNHKSSSNAATTDHEAFYAELDHLQSSCSHGGGSSSSSSNNSSIATEGISTIARHFGKQIILLNNNTTNDNNGNKS